MDVKWASDYKRSYLYNDKCNHDLNESLLVKR